MTYQDSQAKLAEYQRREEQQRKNYAENHKGPCVPWRGAGGKIGSCIYCGKLNCADGFTNPKNKGERGD